MKLKFRFGVAELKGLLVQHVEKIALGFSLLLLVVFLWLGLTLNRYERQPSDLNELITAATNHIKNTDSKELLRDRVPQVDYAKKVDDLDKKTLEAPYSLPMPWDPPMRAQRGQRSDPTLHPAIKVEAVAVTGPLAYRPIEGVVDQTENDAATAVRESAKPKKPRTKKPKRTRASRGGDDTLAADAAAAMPDAGAMPEAAADAGIGMGMGGGGAAPAGSQRRLDVKYYQGFSPASAGAGRIVPVGKTFVAVKALAPYEKQYQEYERTFLNTAGYSGQRDRPRYVFFYAQRADVTANPQGEVKESDWKVVASPKRAMKECDAWAGASNEICDPLHLDEWLTMPAPPLMFRSLDSLLAHSESPRMAVAQVSETSSAEKGKPAEQATSGAPSSDLDLPGAISPQSGPGGAGVNPAAGVASVGPAGPPGGVGPMTGEAPLTIQYKLVRFYDFDVQPGHLYRYRVQLVLEDPNHPENPAADPPLQTLEAAAANRLNGVKAEEQKTGRRKFYRETDWSQPSEIVSIPDPDRLIVGGVAPAQTAAIRNGDTELAYQTREPQGTVLPVIWDGQRGVDVRAERQVYRGSVLNFTAKDAEYAHPVTLQIKSPGDVQFKTEMMVADLRGGESLPGGAKDRPLNGLGEFAVIGPDGSLQVRNELGDREDFRRYSFGTEEVQPSGGASPGGADMMAAPAEAATP